MSGNHNDDIGGRRPNENDCRRQQNTDFNGHPMDLAKSSIESDKEDSKMRKRKKGHGSDGDSSYNAMKLQLAVERLETANRNLEARNQDLIARMEAQCALVETLRCKIEQLEGTRSGFVAAANITTEATVHQSQSARNNNDITTTTTSGSTFTTNWLAASTTTKAAMHQLQPTATNYDSTTIATSGSKAITEWSTEVAENLGAALMEEDDVAPPATVDMSKGAIRKTTQKQPQTTQANNGKSSTTMTTTTLNHQRTTTRNRGADSNTDAGRTVGSGKVSPPIVKVYGVNVKTFMSGLKGLLGHDLFNIDIKNRNMIVLKLVRLEDHARVKQYLIGEGTSFYTFTPRNMRPYTIMLSGLSSTYDVEDLKAFLDATGIKICDMVIKKLMYDRWIVQLGQDSDVKAFRRQRYILGCRIDMVKNKAGGVTQCHNCQRFGHVAANCSMEHRCVRCASPHGPGECSVPSAEAGGEGTLSKDPATGEIVRAAVAPLYCANCKASGHMASDKNCPKRLEVLQRMQERKVTMAPPKRAQVLAPAPPPPRMTAGSYANVARHVNSPTITPVGMRNETAQRAAQAMGFFNAECRRLFGQDFHVYMAKIAGFAETFRGLNSDAEKRQALFGLGLSMAPDGN
ncbi:uncharacterized protein LOC131995847 [Stomoxys calcitrans]|uniref:uncharacterized protein LOC131995847 n=1 Tax=Stomoxys calcitrans TaxID=35570 RepID=UPI0027E21CF3|nr:uncharacterized protein LOC131995847 [Stomoxys calcitrans]